MVIIRTGTNRYAAEGNRVRTRQKVVRGESFSPMWVAAFLYESHKSPLRVSKIPRVWEGAIPTAQRVKSVTGRRFGGMECRASPYTDAMRKRLVKSMLIAEEISEIAIID